MSNYFCRKIGLNILIITAKAHAVDLLTLNTLRGTKNTFFFYLLKGAMSTPVLFILESPPRNITCISLILTYYGFNIPLLNCRFPWASNTSQIRQNEPAGMFGKCLQKRQNQVYKAILFTIAIITNEKETKMKHKLKKIDASFVDTKQLYSNLPESGFSA